MYFLVQQRIRPAKLRCIAGVGARTNLRPHSDKGRRFFIHIISCLSTHSTLILRESSVGNASGLLLAVRNGIATVRSGAANLGEEICSISTESC